MAPTILLVDDQRDILRLLHSTLDTLKIKELEIIEAPSGEEALLEVGRRRVDLLVTDYLLPGITGIELLHKMRVRYPGVRVILITGISDRKAREEMLNAGAVAMFDKPIPLADFLDIVERSLGLVRTIFPTETDARTEAKRSRVSDLLANFRQDIKASAVFLLNDRGLVVARAGDLRDSSLEVSLVSALNAMFSAGLKVAKSNRQENLDQYFVFNGGDNDLILVPVDPSYALLLAGSGIAKRAVIMDTVDALMAVRNEVGKSLRSMGVTAEFTKPPPDPPQQKKGKDAEHRAESTAPEIEALLKDTGRIKVKQEEMDAFWDQAARKHANRPTSAEVTNLLCLGAGAKRVRVMDSPFAGISPASAYAASGIEAAVRAAGGEMEVMSPIKFARFQIPQGKNIQAWELYRDVMETDVLIDVRELRGSGIDYVQLDTSRPLDFALLAYLSARAKRK